MEKKLRDYIQYYIHCDFYLTQREIKTKITNYWPSQNEGEEFCVGYGLDGVNGVEDLRYMKPILRKIDSMDDADIKSFLNWERLNELYVHVSYEKIEHAIVLNYSIPVDGEADYPQSATIMPEIELRSDQFNHLIKNGFDVFGLIESGLAINASTLTK